MKAILIILSVFFLLGCRSKMTKKEKLKSEETTEIQIDKKVDSLQQKKEEKKEVKKSEVSEQKKETSTEFEVKGKAETGKPIEIYDIQEGDTLQSFKVTGNAEVSIKSKRSSSEKLKKEDSFVDTQNLIEKYSRAAVKEKNLVKAGKTIKNTAKELKVTDTSTGIYITAIVLGAVTIVILFIFIYFKKNKKQ